MKKLLVSLLAAGLVLPSAAALANDNHLVEGSAATDEAFDKAFNAKTPEEVAFENKLKEEAAKKADEAWVAGLVNEPVKAGVLDPAKDSEVLRGARVETKDGSVLRVLPLNEKGELSDTVILGKAGLVEDTKEEAAKKEEAVKKAVAKKASAKAGKKALPKTSAAK